MPNARSNSVSFAGGEITPELFGRFDLVKVRTGLALARNFEILPPGPAQNRAGTQFVKEVANSAKKTRTITFDYTNTQTFAIELGEKTMRWHTNGATLLYTASAWVSGRTYYPGTLATYSGGEYECYVQVTGTTTPDLDTAYWRPVAYDNATAYAPNDITKNGGVYYYCLVASTGNAPPNAAYWYALPADGTYEIPTPYLSDDLFAIHFVQSADVMTLVHPSYPIYELHRNGPSNWQMIVVNFAPTIIAPASTGSTGTPVTCSYVVTATSGPYESTPSAVATCSNDLTVSGNYNELTWTASLANSYYVYKLVNGVYGRLGTTKKTSFIDDGSLTPDPSVTPPTVSSVPIFVAVIGLSATAYAPGTTSVTATATGGGLTAYTYGVTACNDSGAESLLSSTATCSNDLTTAGHYNTVRWPVVAGATYYKVYKLSNGLFGYIGQASTISSDTSFVDNNILADISNTPPLPDQTLNSGTNFYPAAVGYFEQRKAFAGWNASPQSIIATKSGTEDNMNYHVPTLADDRLSVRMAARQASSIRHIVPVQDVILLSASNVTRMFSTDGNAIVAANVSLKPQSYVGCSNVQPVVVDNTIIYASARGGHIREISYSWQAQSYITGDLSLPAVHLFDGFDIVDMAFTQTPYPIVWCVNTSGTLIGLTYVRDQQVAAWHHHDTDGVIESCCTVSETNDLGQLEDFLYLVVARQIGGATKRYVERKASRFFQTLADSYFVDCGATFTSETPVSSISGLDWLEGKTVSILANGAVVPQQVVTGGSVTLPFTATTVHVGLPITSQLQTAPFAVAASDMLQGHQKNINRVYPRLTSSSGIRMGPDFNNLTLYPQRTTEPYGSPPSLITSEIDMLLTPQWGPSGQLCLQQTDPLPITLCSMTFDLTSG